MSKTRFCDRLYNESQLVLGKTLALSPKTEVNHRPMSELRKGRDFAIVALAKPTHIGISSPESPSEAKDERRRRESFAGSGDSAIVALAKPTHIGISKSYLVCGID